MSSDIDGRIYRRFSYLRNRLLLQRQDELSCLEEELKALDLDDNVKRSNNDVSADKRLISRRFDETWPAVRKGVLDRIDLAMKEYDDLLLREHEIMSIQNPPKRIHEMLFRFVFNGQRDQPDGKKKRPITKDELQFLYHRDDSLLLGNQDDAWLGSHIDSVKNLIPKKLRDVSESRPSNRATDPNGKSHTQLILSSPEKRKLGQGSSMSFYDNDRTSKFIKALVAAATTVLLVLPIFILYVLSVHGASGYLKIGVLLIFVVMFALALPLMTNASRSEMFGASAG
jgi:hypothetical protein